MAGLDLAIQQNIEGALFFMDSRIRAAMTAEFSASARVFGYSFVKMMRSRRIGPFARVHLAYVHLGVPKSFRRSKRRSCSGAGGV
jgi:hypothetical protein